MTTSIQIEPVCPQFHQAVAELMAYGFGHKFQKITSLSITDLAYVFEQLLNHPPMELSTLRVIGCENEEIVGTMCLKWKEASNRVAIKTVHANSHWWSKCNRIGNWKLLQLITSLHLLKHTPKLGECYVEDLVVHPHTKARELVHSCFNGHRNICCNPNQCHFLACMWQVRIIKQSGYMSAINFASSIVQTAF